MSVNFKSVPPLMRDLEIQAIASAKARPVPRCYEPVIYRTPVGLVRVRYGFVSDAALINADRDGVALSKSYFAEWLADEFADLPTAVDNPRCPHCGSDRVTVGYDGQPATSFHAVCTTCGAQGPRDQGGRSGSGVCDASSCISSAMELWVRRVGG